MFRVLFRLLSKKMGKKGQTWELLLGGGAGRFLLQLLFLWELIQGRRDGTYDLQPHSCSLIHALHVFFDGVHTKIEMLSHWCECGFQLGFKTWSALSVFCGRLLLHSFLVLFAHGLLQSLICRLWLSFPCPKCFNQRTILDTEIHQGTWLSNTINQNPTRKLNMALSRTKSTQHHVPVLFAELCQSQFGCHRTALTSYWT